MQVTYHRNEKPTIVLNVNALMEMTFKQRAYFYELWELKAEDIIWFEDKILIKKTEDTIQFWRRAFESSIN